MLELKTYKNWKEICEVMGWKTNCGNYKKSKIKELDSICKYNKFGNSWTIEEIYDKPLQKEDNRGKNGLYTDDIQELLLCALYKSDSNIVRWSLNTILEKVNMINLDYIKYRKNMDNLSGEINMRKDYIEEFYNCNHSNLRIKIESSLNSLRKRSLVMYSKIIMIDITEVEISYNEMGNPKIGDDGKVIYQTHNMFRKANENECRVILKYEKMSMKKLKCKNKGEIISKGKWKEYNDYIYQKLKSSNIKFYYNAYEIIFNNDDVKNDIVGDLGEICTKQKLNKNIQKCLIKSANTRHKNAKDKEEIVLYKQLHDDIDSESIKINELRISYDYVENNIALVNKLIKSI